MRVSTSPPFTTTEKCEKEEIKKREEKSEKAYFPPFHIWSNMVSIAVAKYGVLTQMPKS